MYSNPGIRHTISVKQFRVVNVAHKELVYCTKRLERPYEIMALKSLIYLKLLSKFPRCCKARFPSYA